MIKQLILKEIQESLISTRFVASLFFLIVLFLSGALIFCKKYESQLEDYRSGQSNAEQMRKIAERGLQTLYQQRLLAAKEPRLSLFFASGNETRYPRSLNVSISVVGRGGLFSSTDLNAQRQNYLLDPYQDFDIVFIFGVVLSFLAIVLGFDAISRDREQGTLRLQLSNGVGRSQILLAKYVALLVLLFIPTIIGSVCSIALVHVITGKNMLFLFPLESLLNIGMGFFYLSVFIWIALWFSSLFSKPSTSLAVMLLLWTFITLLTPVLGGMLAPRFRPVESEEDFGRRFQSVIQQAMKATPPEALDFWQGKRKETEVDWNAVERGFDASGQIIADYYLNHLNSLFGQVAFAEALNFLSPYGAYRQASERLSNTGLSYHRKFINTALEYRLTLKNFIREQDLRDPESKHRMIWHPMLTALSKKPMDPKTIPVFTPPSPNASFNDVQAAVPSVGYLFFLNAVFFFLALGTFARADVR